MPHTRRALLAAVQAPTVATSCRRPVTYIRTRCPVCGCRVLWTAAELQRELAHPTTPACDEAHGPHDEDSCAVRCRPWRPGEIAGLLADVRRDTTVT